MSTVFNSVAHRPNKRSVSTRFKFGLERVRQVRAHAEDRAKEDLAASIAERGRQESELVVVQQRLAAAHEAARSGGTAGVGGTVSGMSLQATQAWSERLERSRREATNAVVTAEAIVSARRTQLMEAGRKREVLDRLRERKLSEHRLAEGRAEGALLDEMALTMHLRAKTAS